MLWLWLGILAQVQNQPEEWGLEHPWDCRWPLGSCCWAWRLRAKMWQGGGSAQPELSSCPPSGGRWHPGAVALQPGTSLVSPPPCHLPFS